MSVTVKQSQMNDPTSVLLRRCLERHLAFSVKRGRHKLIGLIYRRLKICEMMFEAADGW